MSTLLTTATHVERTDDPAVMRWVCHRADLDASADGHRVPPHGSPLGDLVDQGLLAGVELRGGDVLLQVPDAGAWPALVAQAHEAVVTELSTGQTWLTDEPTNTAGSTSATVAVTDASDDASESSAVGCGTGSEVTSSACAGCHVRSACGTGSRGPNRLRQVLFGERLN